MLRMGTGRIQAVEGHREDTGWGEAKGGYSLGRDTDMIHAWEGHMKDTGWGGAHGGCRLECGRGRI